MKAFTDISQSKKLAGFLPLESADMCYVNDGTAIKIDANPYTVRYSMWKDYAAEIIPCWSLAALYSVLPTFTLDSSDDKYFRIHCCKKFSEWYNNPIDATFEIILKLKEMNLL